MTTQLLFTILSGLAVVCGILAAWPQLWKMWQHKSSKGQSPLGWVLGLFTNVSLTLVNLGHYGALLLAVGNCLNAFACAGALYLIYCFRQDSPTIAINLDNFHTGEFQALHSAVVDEHEKRHRARQQKEYSPLSNA